MIGWSIEPPEVLTHLGLRVNLLTLDKKALHTLLYEGWLRYVTTQLQHRKTFVGMTGIDIHLAQLDYSRLTALELARTQSLQCGAFLSPWQQAKFDNTKSPVCSLCLVPDSQQHWLTCARYHHLPEHTENLARWSLELPLWTTQHLLVSPPAVREHWTSYLQGLPFEYEFQSQPSEGPQHLFVDGSCMQHGAEHLTTASWGVLNATTGLTVAASHLAGLTQTIGRAELFAYIASIDWFLYMKCSGFIWSDSQYATHLVQRILAGTCELSNKDGENQDLIDRLTDMATHLSEGQVQAFWIPSHLDEARCDTDYETWIAVWNNKVDHLAVQVNQTRSSTFWTLTSSLADHHRSWSDILRTLRKFYLAVAEFRAEQNQQTPEVILIDDTDWDLQVEHTSLHEALPLNWLEVAEQTFCKVPQAYLSHVIQVLSAIDEPDEHFLPLSIIEIAFLCLRRPDFCVLHKLGTSVQMVTPCTLFCRPTFASVVTNLKLAVLFLGSCFSLERYLIHSCDRTNGKILYPTLGVVCRMSNSTLESVRRDVQAFTAGKGFRKAADLAKPLP